MLPSDMSPGLSGTRQKSHIAICGTGRAGTTLLVRILHSAGLDTGFTRSQIDKTLNHVARAGLERGANRQTVESLPDVIKGPSMYKWAAGGLSEGWLKLDRIIVPVRDIDEVLKSRRRVTSRSFHEYFTKGRLRGGFVGGPKMLFKQREATLELFFQSVHMAVVHGVPLNLLSFPRFARDEDYFIEALGRDLWSDRGMDEKTLRYAHRKECNPELIRINR